ncbi:hypothetical protein K491DRAFT_711575 [Lophiostoma macrostomum CBS 122681]|uniref:Uncharacterized protein n=1 Tax=Lophiostoma macrostomum CBS 122681 TaxID=1314788 RepID=A0A6A6TKW8_9PLEO|nr:hypothetical protein K491DRAFT_711575 [Lophiostoma macrostomum CBS 122681]
MGIYLHYLYGDPEQDYLHPSKYDPPGADQDEQALLQAERVYSLFQCFFLGDLLRDKGFKRQIIEWIRKTFNGNHASLIEGRVALEMYKLAHICPPGGLFKDFVLDMIVVCGNREVTADNFLDYCPVEMAKDIARKHLQREPSTFLPAYFLDKYGTDEETSGLKIVRFLG